MSCERSRSNDEDDFAPDQACVHVRPQELKGSMGSQTERSSFELDHLLILLINTTGRSLQHDGCSCDDKHSFRCKKSEQRSNVQVIEVASLPCVTWRTTAGVLQRGIEGRSNDIKRARLLTELQEISPNLTRSKLQPKVQAGREEGNQRASLSHLIYHRLTRNLSL